MNSADDLESPDRKPPAFTDANSVEALFKWPIVVAAFLVIPDLILDEQPLTAHWHEVAAVVDWAIWLVFALEFAAVLTFAQDRRSWLRRNPIVMVMLVLTPPFAPGSFQALRAFRLLRVLRVVPSWNFLSRLISLEGLKYLAVAAVFLIVGGGTVFASVENHAGHHVSTWDGIYWAIGTISTEGSPIGATTNAGRAISIVLMLVGIGIFSMVTAALAQQFIHSRAAPKVARLTDGEERIIDDIAALSARLEQIELHVTRQQS